MSLSDFTVPKSQIGSGILEGKEAENLQRNGERHGGRKPGPALPRKTPRGINRDYRNRQQLYGKRWKLIRTIEEAIVQSEAENEVNPKSPLKVDGPLRKNPIPGLPVGYVLSVAVSISTPLM